MSEYKDDKALVLAPKKKKKKERQSVIRRIMKIEDRFDGLDWVIDAYKDLTYQKNINEVIKQFK